MSYAHVSASYNIETDIIVHSLGPSVGLIINLCFRRILKMLNYMTPWCLKDLP